MSGRGRAAAALLVLTAFACGIGMLAQRVQVGPVPLVIEVLEAHEQDGEHGEDVPAAAMQSGEKPRVLLYHTHTYEAYEMTEGAAYTPTETWRTRDEHCNMLRVGEELARLLTEHGFEVVQDRTAFEPPDLSGAYVRSLEMLERRIQAGESYDYIFDIHRDAYSGPYNGANSVQGENGAVAYVMLLVGKGTGATGAGFDRRPDWPQNLALAQRLTDSMNEQLAGVSREVKVKAGRFNQHISTGALLIEVGNNRNTLEEALAACPIIAQAVASVHAQRASDELAHVR